MLKRKHNKGRKCFISCHLDITATTLIKKKHVTLKRGEMGENIKAKFISIFKNDLFHLLEQRTYKMSIQPMLNFQINDSFFYFLTSTTCLLDVFHHVLTVC